MSATKAGAWLEDDGLAFIENLAAKGMTFEEMADALGVSTSTFRLWRGRHSAISAAVKRGHMKRAHNVENSLLDLACGYCVEETEETITKEILDNGRWVAVERKTRTTKRHVPPNPSAAIFSQKNLSGWRDKQPEKTAREIDQEVKSYIEGLRFDKAAELLGSVESVI